MSDPDLSIGSSNDLGHRYEIELRNSIIEECALVADEFAKLAVGNCQADGTRNPAIYEQGIGAERVAAAIRALKEKP